jgi:beta-mannosidase
VPGSSNIAPAIFRSTDYRKLKTTDPGITFSITDFGEKQCTVQVSAKAYAHAVHFRVPGDARLSDNFFDLLPGETREVHIVSPKPLGRKGIGVTCVNVQQS